MPLVIGLAVERYLSMLVIYDVSTDPVSAPDWLKTPSADQIWLKRVPVTPVIAKSSWKPIPN